MPKKNNQKAPKTLGPNDAGASEVLHQQKTEPDATELEVNTQQKLESNSQDLEEAVSVEVIDGAALGADNLEQNSSETDLSDDLETDDLETDPSEADLPDPPETDSPETDETELEAPEVESAESDILETDTPDQDTTDPDAPASDALDLDTLDESTKPSAMRYEDIEIEHFVPGKYQLEEDEDLTAEQQPAESSDEQFSPQNESFEDSDYSSTYGSSTSPEVTATLLPYKQGDSENSDLQSAVVTPLLGQRNKKLWTKDSGDDGAETTTRRSGNALLWIGMIMILIALLIGGYLIFRYITAASSYNRLATIAGLDTAALDDPTYTVEPKDLNIDWETLKAINPDIVAWIYIPGTNLSYPVVHGEDNEYYLTHTADGSYNTSGAIFLDYQNTPGYTDRSNWTYGHNMVAQTMFYPITNFTSEQFLAEHSRILVFTPEKTYDLTVIGAIRCSGTTPIRRTSFTSDADFNKYLTTLGSYQVSGKYSDMMAANNVFCFSTCDRLDRTVRIIVIATDKNTGDIDVPLPDNAPT
ncbi:MAG: class B sortase, partial [Coriobacteriales bacterium]|nr:class B sortase [Coriobacteriales bacterium]